MKEVFINNSMGIIKKYYPNYSEDRLAELKYGLEGLYLMISKSIIIFGIAIYLGIFKELLIFTIIYNVLRAPSFGLHASKSWICLISSATIFILSTFLSVKMTIPINYKVIFGIIGILLIYKNSPADTAKRPIVSPIRRKVYKIISTAIAILFTLLSWIIESNFLSNTFILSLLIQCVFTAPTMYKLCGEPYDNYKSYRP